MATPWIFGLAGSSWAAWIGWITGGLIAAVAGFGIGLMRPHVPTHNAR